jgi:hypothetical protein
MVFLTHSRVGVIRCMALSGACFLLGVLCAPAQHVCAQSVPRRTEDGRRPVPPRDLQPDNTPHSCVVEAVPDLYLLPEPRFDPRCPREQGAVSAARMIARRWEVQCLRITPDDTEGCMARCRASPPRTRRQVSSCLAECRTNSPNRRCAEGAREEFVRFLRWRLRELRGASDGTGRGPMPERVDVTVGEARVADGGVPSR